jgi:hypothetical protein
MTTPLFTQNTIACIWDFDKTLIPEYMQSPLFKRFNIDENNFWKETNALLEEYHKQGYRLSGEIGYLNHLLTYVLSGKMSGLNNKILKETGSEINFYPGLPEFFINSKNWINEKEEYKKLNITLEHYIVSTGLAQIIRGSVIAPYTDGIWGCEFIESPLQPGFLKQGELSINYDSEIAQIGMVIDNTTKTRALFEINKGTNKNATIDVNATISNVDRRIPFHNMIYIADGPSDIPSFSVVKNNGGLAYAVYNTERQDEFEQCDAMRQSGRINHYGTADYRLGSDTTNWLKLNIEKIANNIININHERIHDRIDKPPRHLNNTRVINPKNDVTELYLIKDNIK